MPGIVSFETGESLWNDTDAFLPEVAVTLRERGFRSGLGPPFQELGSGSSIELTDSHDYIFRHTTCIALLSLLVEQWRRTCRIDILHLEAARDFLQNM